LFRESARLQAELRELNTLIRPFELGVAEINLNEEFVALVGDLFTVNKFPVKEYDMPSETAEKLASGEWESKLVDRTRGKTKYNENSSFDPTKVGEDEDEDEDKE